MDDELGGQVLVDYFQLLFYVMKIVLESIGC